MESLNREAELAEVFKGINGLSHAEIADGFERAKVDRECLYICPDDNILCKRLHNIIQEVPDTYHDIRTVLLCAAMLIRSKKWYSDDCYISLCGNEEPDDAAKYSIVTIAKDATPNH